MVQDPFHQQYAKQISLKQSGGKGGCVNGVNSDDHMLRDEKIQPGRMTMHFAIAAMPSN